MNASMQFEKKTFVVSDPKNQKIIDIITDPFTQQAMIFEWITFDIIPKVSKS